MATADQGPALARIVESASKSYVSRRTRELETLESRLSTRLSAASDRMAPLLADPNLRAGLERLVTLTATTEPVARAVEAQYRQIADEALRDAGIEPAEVAKEVLSVLGRPEGAAFRGILFALDPGLLENPETGRLDQEEE